MTPLTPASPEVADLAARHRLGPLQGVFAPQRLRRVVFAAHVFNCLMRMAFFLVPGLLYYWFSIRRFPDFSRKRAAQRLHLFEEGLVVHPPSGGAPAKYVCSASAPGQGAVRITEFYEDPDVWGPRMQDAVMRAQRLTCVSSPPPDAHSVNGLAAGVRRTIGDAPAVSAADAEGHRATRKARWY
ncbi:hypothetical protein ACFY0F_06005 [Streptomyces sp. NPDC001544]|uniref:hypothetical protein n=1 Tax=Streptomyces sp. NPDC001544 TaxID=3364584 RepID=UPI003688FA5D